MCAGIESVRLIFAIRESLQRNVYKGNRQTKQHLNISLSLFLSHCLVILSPWETVWIHQKETRVSLENKTKQASIHIEMHRENGLDNMALLFLDNSLSLSLPLYEIESTILGHQFHLRHPAKSDQLFFFFSTASFRLFFPFEFLGWRREKGTELIF
jgi:hypothetical protein